MRVDATGGKLVVVGVVLGIAGEGGRRFNGEKEKTACLWILRGAVNRR
jgi:hypothetical protein